MRVLYLRNRRLAILAVSSDGQYIISKVQDDSSKNEVRKLLLEKNEIIKLISNFEVFYQNSVTGIMFLIQTSLNRSQIIVISVTENSLVYHDQSNLNDGNKFIRILKSMLRREETIPINISRVVYKGNLIFDVIGSQNSNLIVLRIQLGINNIGRISIQNQVRISEMNLNEAIPNLNSIISVTTKMDEAVYILYSNFMGVHEISKIIFDFRTNERIETVQVPLPNEIQDPAEILSIISSHKCTKDFLFSRNPETNVSKIFSLENGQEILSGNIEVPGFLVINERILLNAFISGNYFNIYNESFQSSNQESNLILEEHSFSKDSISEMKEILKELLAAKSPINAKRLNLQSPFLLEAINDITMEIAKESLKMNSVSSSLSKSSFLNTKGDLVLYEIEKRLKRISKWLEIVGQTVKFHHLDFSVKEALKNAFEKLKVIKEIRLFELENRDTVEFSFGVELYRDVEKLEEMIQTLAENNLKENDITLKIQIFENILNAIISHRRQIRHQINEEPEFQKPWTLQNKTFAFYIVSLFNSVIRPKNKVDFGENKLMFQRLANLVATSIIEVSMTKMDARNSFVITDTLRNLHNCLHAIGLYEKSLEIAISHKQIEIISDFLFLSHELADNSEFTKCEIVSRITDFLTSSASRKELAFLTELIMSRLKGKNKLDLSFLKTLLDIDNSLIEKIKTHNIKIATLLLVQMGILDNDTITLLQTSFDNEANIIVKSTFLQYLILFRFQNSKSHKKFLNFLLYMKEQGYQSLDPFSINQIFDNLISSGKYEEAVLSLEELVTIQKSFKILPSDSKIFSKSYSRLESESAIKENSYYKEKLNKISTLISNVNEIEIEN